MEFARFVERSLLSAYKGLKHDNKDGIPLTGSGLLSAYKGLKLYFLRLSYMREYSLLSAYKGLKPGG